ncbi:MULTISPECIES: Lrp/AsnC family transcriptional regulator [unclassified Paenibacillus]|uniref:Lrp/AsnC family transcriptional regulator n=1 Tax=unclassified Paenibacillus TaxID=185978 RepID=UPI002474A1F6|nr:MULTISPECIES: Lrp/AsnC family transcriptional regulator [unclassified Paenibacillus]MDH6425902.1 Lrp/AsnC family leucine-responsive transcriptional regulator [Paenibacillus sp. PastH-4]MDH6441923.1 Lrp/AsnC family leucine-responsive transcriptional regulator [Paenibacillus sp. PastF-4]MDH6527362.1 Lrp/AsnC family leucine-responsive transcriptional regulator [Paenibacillus sp. PastH-3]
MDHVDKQILFQLQNQARISMTELGKCVGLSQPAVTERVRRMEEKGIISEYRTIISPEKIGKQAAAYMLFHSRDCNAFLDFCRSSPDVVECYRISGEHNYLLKVVTDSTRALEEFGNQCDKYGTYTILIVMSSPIDHKFLIPSLEEASLNLLS